MATQTIPAFELGFAARRHSQQAAERNLQLLAAQQRARRGPTPEVFFAKRIDNSRLVKAADPVRVREMRTFTAAMAALFVIVMFYGWQHFSAIEYGYHVEAEKQQRAQLQEQNRQLHLAEAQLCDLTRLDQMAHKLGLEPPRPGQVVQGTMESTPGTAVMAQASPITLGK